MTAARHDWRLVGPALAVWGGSLIGTAALPGWQLGLAGLLVAGLGAWLWRRHQFWLAAAAVVLLAATALSAVRTHQLQADVPARLAAEGAAAVVRIRLVGDPLLLPATGTRPAFAVARCELIELTARGTRVSAQQPMVALASGDLAAALADAEPGATHDLHGLLSPAEPGAPEALAVRVRSISVPIAPPGALDRWVNQLRAGLRAATAHSPPDQAALLPSLVVGDTAAMSEELREQFRVTALSHLSAVSGANLSLLLIVVLACARALGARGWAVRAAALACVGLFVLVCRSEPSVIRAAAMGLVAVSALGLGRGRRSIRTLSLAVVCLTFLDPWLSRSWGFALSVAACAGIALLAPGWLERLAGWLPRWLAEAIVVPLAAQLATQPLVVALNGQVSVVGLIANVLAAPFVGPATVLGLAAMCSIWCPPLAAALAWVGGWCVQPILTIAQVGSGLPAASWAWPSTPVGIALAALGCVALAGLMGRLLTVWWVAVALVVALMLAAWVRPVPWGWPGDWLAVFCDVGQGDATVLRAGDGAAVLVDTGPDPRSTRDCLASLGITRVPLLVLTHFHADHIGGVAWVVQQYRPEIILISPLAEPALAAAAVERVAEVEGARTQVALAGQVVRVGDVTWTTVSAWQPPATAATGEGESGVENDSSVVGIAQVGHVRVMLPGDVEPAGQRAALAEARGRGLSLRADILKLPHHGSSRQDPEFFAATRASLAVASAGLDNDYGHPAPAALRLAGAQNMTVTRTDEDGSIAVGCDDGTLVVRVER